MIKPTKTVNMPENGHITELFGTLDGNIKKIEKAFNVRVANRDDTLNISGENEGSVLSASSALETLVRLVEKGEALDDQKIDYLISAHLDKIPSAGDALLNLSDDTIALTAKGAPIRAKTIGQKKYIELMRKNTIVFSVGPAGTGKTYLSMAMAVAAFKKGEVSRIILTRPAIEAGEKLGFLPGDMQQKVDPYLRPLYDALNDIMGQEAHLRNIEKNTIEVAPLAYMRGRTLDNAFIVLDEAQNTTPEQMKMFLTRIGFGSKCIVTGDITQVDLPEGKKSGLIEAVKILRNIEGIGISLLSNKDVVRHPLVQKIVNAYDMAYKKQAVREMKRQERK